MSKAEKKYYERLEIEGVPPIFSNYVNELKQQNEQMLEHVQSMYGKLLLDIVKSDNDDNKEIEIRSDILIQILDKFKIICEKK